ncbi:hypothetical protein ACOSP7_027813 [Xanthoceras sorbifolium]
MNKMQLTSQCDESNFNGDSSILPYGAWMRASNPGKSQPSWYNRRNQSPPKPNPPRHGQGNTNSDQYHDGKTAFHETANDLNASNIVSSSPGESKAMAVSAAASSEGKTNQMDVSTAATTLIFQQQEGSDGIYSHNAGQHVAISGAETSTR